MGHTGTLWGRVGHNRVRGDTPPHPSPHLRWPQPLHATLQCLLQAAIDLLDPLHLQGRESPQNLEEGHPHILEEHPIDFGGTTTGFFGFWLCFFLPAV